MYLKVTARQLQRFNFSTFQLGGSNKSVRFLNMNERNEQTKLGFWEIDC